jgi:hypothetical protein
VLPLVTGALGKILGARVPLLGATGAVAGLLPERARLGTPPLGPLGAEPIEAARDQTTAAARADSDDDPGRKGHALGMPLRERAWRKTASAVRSPL